MLRECCLTDIVDTHSVTCYLLALPILLEISFTQEEIYEAVEKYMQLKIYVAVSRAGQDPSQVYIYRNSVANDPTISFRAVQLPSGNETKH